MCSIERPGKTFWGTWKDLEFFQSKRVATLVESLDLETSFLAFTYIFEVSRLRSSIKVIGSRSRSQEQKTSSDCLQVVCI